MFDKKFKEEAEKNLIERLSDHVGEGIIQGHDLENNQVQILWFAEQFPKDDREFYVWKSEVFLKATKPEKFYHRVMTSVWQSDRYAIAGNGRHVNQVKENFERFGHYSDESLYGNIPVGSGPKLTGMLDDAGAYSNFKIISTSGNDFIRYDGLREGQGKCMIYSNGTVTEPFNIPIEGDMDEILEKYLQVLNPDNSRLLVAVRKGIGLEFGGKEFQTRLWSPNIYNKDEYQMSVKNTPKESWGRRMSVRRR